MTIFLVFGPLVILGTPSLPHSSSAVGEMMPVNSLILFSTLLCSQQSCSRCFMASRQHQHFPLRLVISFSDARTQGYLGSGVFFVLLDRTGYLCMDHLLPARPLVSGNLEFLIRNYYRQPNVEASAHHCLCRLLRSGPKLARSLTMVFLIQKQYRDEFGDDRTQELVIS